MDASEQGTIYSFLIHLVSVLKRANKNLGTSGVFV